MKLSDTHYEKFTPRERLALFYEAMSRRDYSEADRLSDTCERKSYTMQDAVYLQTLQHIHVFCLYTVSFIKEAKARAVAALGIFLFAQEKGREKLRDEAIDAYRAAIGEILGTWVAWQEFCATAGIDPEFVMRTCWGEVPEEINNYLLMEATRPIEADPAAKSRTLDLIMGRWRAIQAQLAA